MRRRTPAADPPRRSLRGLLDLLEVQLLEGGAHGTEGGELEAAPDDRADHDGLDLRPAREPDLDDPVAGRVHALHALDHADPRELVRVRRADEGPREDGSVRAARGLLDGRLLEG